MKTPPFVRTAASVLVMLAVVTVLGGTSASVLGAQPLELLGDLQPGPHLSYGFGVTPIGTVNGKALLHAPAEAFAIWATDGTAAGTLPIADVSFGGGASAKVVNATPQRAFILIDAAGVIAGGRIFRTDGTHSGTFVLRNAEGQPLVPSGYLAAADANGGYFAACIVDHDCGWWFNDGSTAVSRLLLTFDNTTGDTTAATVLGGSLYWTSGSRLFTTRFDQPGARLVFGASGDDYIRGLIESGGRLYFAAKSTGGYEAWSSDGTSAGTHVLTAFASDQPFSPIANFYAAGGRVYFVASDITTGQELWSTDGTATGTRRETDFAYYQPFGLPGIGEALPLGVIGNKLLFGATDGLNGYQLWVKSGNGAPVPLLDPCGSDCSPLQIGNGMLVAGGRAYFGAADLNHGYELWSSDGTKSGTQLLVDSCPGPCGDGLFGRAMLVGGHVFAWTFNDLWVTDGTPQGTRSLHHDDNGLPVVNGGSKMVLPAGDKFVFSAQDPTYGNEIFVADSTLESAELLTVLHAMGADSQPQTFTSLGDRAVFSALSAGHSGDAALWVTDGTPAGTSEVPGVALQACDSSGRLCQEITAVGSQLFFMQSEGFGYQLWRTDGSAGGLLQLTHDVQGLSSSPGVAWAGKLLFSRDTESGFEIWTSDGTVAGTHALFTLPGLVSLYALSATGADFYFVAANGSSLEAWRSDGTLAGTRQVTAFGSSGHRPSGYGFVRAGNLVWFLADAPGTGELWVSDGTAAGTRLVANPNGTSNLVSFNGVLYFLAQASPSERALWRVNDQANGITQLARFPGNGFYPIGAYGLTVFQGSLYLAASSTAEGSELWTSDGTAAGTRLLRDLNPGADGSQISGLTATPHGLFFAANDGVHGPELWRSDGTAAGTLLVADLEPGPVGSYPGVPALAGNHLVFGATEDSFGREPWSLDLAAPRACIASDTALCLDGARYRVTANWKDFQGNRGVGHAVGLTADTGYFWFFGQENVEVMIKVLDGRGVNGHDWVFYGALSSVEYTLTVTDTQTGAVRRYVNPTGRLASVGDTQGFGPLGAYSRTAPPAADPAPPARRIASGDTSPCVASSTRLCLNGGRFEVQAAWKDFSNHTGVGHAVSLTGDTGYLWFFSNTNVEVVIKVLDGRPLNQKFWLFYGALSSVEYTLTVRDTVTGAVRVYHNVSGHMASVADTTAF